MKESALERARVEVVPNIETWRRRLLSPDALAKLAKELGLGCFSTSDITGLWKLGLLRADFVLSDIPMAIHHALPQQRLGLKIRHTQLVTSSTPGVCFTIPTKLGKLNMDLRLSLLIHDYLCSVSSAVRLMVEGGIDLPASNREWARSDIEPEGLLPGAVTYVKHGYGCAVHLPGALVDFDFGANGETTGFDAWRLQSFAAERIREYGFASELELETTFIEAVGLGKLSHAGKLYYLVERNDG